MLQFIDYYNLLIIHFTQFLIPLYCTIIIFTIINMYCVLYFITFYLFKMI